MKKNTGFIVALLIIIYLPVLAVEKAEVEKKIKEPQVRLLEKAKEKIDFSSYYEYSWIKQGARRGQWRLLTNRLAYSANNQTMPYLEVSSWDRFHNKDYIINTGAYFKLSDASYLHSGIGFGGDISYVYRFQTTLEYERRFIKNYFWQLGYRYLNYPDNDVFIAYPGFIYYFGNHYLTVLYNASFTESRDTAQWGTAKANFGLNERLNLWLGTAIGQRLYDINLLEAQDQYGYIAFLGADFKIYKDLKLRLGYSYSKERPDFIKRSLDYGFSIKF